MAKTASGMAPDSEIYDKILYVSKDGNQGHSYRFIHKQNQTSRFMMCAPYRKLGVQKATTQIKSGFGREDAG